VFVLLLLILAQGAPESLPAPAPAPAPAPVSGVTVTAARDKGPRALEIVMPGPKGEALICKKYQPVGSRLPIRACRTAYDWAELNAASLRNLDQMTSKGTYP
jgi:hypothetical protein